MSTKAIDLKTRFKKDLAPQLKETLKVKNVMAVPRVKKVTISVGIGSYIKAQKRDPEHVIKSITAISGQKPIITKAKKAISNFKSKQGDLVGVVATLRGARMYDFLNKLINIVFPRVRDFRGISVKSFDQQGNLSVGFREHTVFPEISPDEVMNLHGVQITIATSAKNNEEGYELLKAMGFPFKK